jgi:hypothetical protein
MKGPDAGFPLFTAAESYFLQAEASVLGISMSGSTKSLFESGILSSFKYLHQLPDGKLGGDKATLLVNGDTVKVGGKPVLAEKYLVEYNKYLFINDSYLVQFDDAVTQAQQIEAIITQKYIALNFVHSHEGWNEYRRTGYPALELGDGHSTFASPTSISTRADKLPSRILYPSSEIQYNADNVPAGINPYSSLIFWAK